MEKKITLSRDVSIPALTGIPGLAQTLRLVPTWETEPLPRGCQGAGCTIFSLCSPTRRTAFDALESCSPRQDSQFASLEWTWNRQTNLVFLCVICEPGELNYISINGHQLERTHAAMRDPLFAWKQSKCLPMCFCIPHLRLFVYWAK